MMNLEDKISALSKLSKLIASRSQELDDVVEKAVYSNRWFTKETIFQALDAIATQFLNREKLEAVSGKYSLMNQKGGNRIGMVLAGNIPAVGFHDILCTFLCDHVACIKYSQKDTLIIKYLLSQLGEIDARCSDYFIEVERLKEIDAIIATGSNNTSGYFESYFGKYPNIIRKNRNGVGILTGKEDQKDLIALGQDIFNHYGLGCRNVSFILVPDDYNFDFLLGTLHDHYKQIVNHNKYKNNFDLNFATWMMNKVKFLMSGSLLITELDQIASNIGTLHYKRYSDKSEVVDYIQKYESQIQCVVSKDNWDGIDRFDFGHAQSPSFTDYADGVDTIQFLLGI